MLRHLLLHSYLLAVGVAMTVALALPAAPTEFDRAGATLSEDSIYLLDSTWTNDRGAPLKLTQLQGHYQIVGFIFTKCGGTCPMLVKSMQYHARSLPKDIRQRMRFLLVTIDPEHDIPPVLQQYRQDMGLPPNEWTLLHGSDANVRELAAVVGFNYARDENGMFTHSNVVTLLDPGGVVLLQHPSGSGDWSAIAQRIAALEAQRGAAARQLLNDQR